MIKSTNPYYEGYTLINYEFSTLCDKECSYCYNMYQHDKRFSIPHQKIVDDMTTILTADNPYLILILIGGETLIQPKFEEIIDHITKIKQPETKIILYTHADHEFNFFKSKIDTLKVFGDKIKIHCTLHWENLNFEQFTKNIKYINDNFNYCTMFFFLNNMFLNNQNYIDNLLEIAPKLKLYALKFDGAKGLDLIKQVTLYKQIEKYNNKMDNTITINQMPYPHNIGMNILYKETKYCFKGKRCTLLDYDIDKFGNVKMSCTNEILFNIRENFDKSFFNLRTITCQENQCMSSLANLLVE